MLEVRNLAFSYRRHPVLRDVSFVVSPGEVVSVVGANGCGKTTLLRVLATLAFPDAGRLVADGADAFADPMRYRRQVGYLPERPALYEDMTVKDYLTFRAQLKGETPRRIRRRISEAAEMCRVTGLLATGIHRLSEGLKRRVALADALLQRPRVLLLDDFLAGLDVPLRAATGEILKEAAAFSAVIVTGHELADLVHWSTRFLVLDKGVVAATVPAAGASPAELEARLRGVLTGGAA